MNNSIAETAKIFPDVILGKNITIEDYCIIGTPAKGQEGLKTYIGDNAVIRSHTVIYAGNKIGRSFQTGNKANIRELNEIGDNVSIGTLSVIEHHVKIGNDVRIHSQVFIPEFSVLEDDSWVGPNVVFTNAKFPKTENTKNTLQGPILKKGARIGANSTLLPGVVVGEGSLVGAGSIVTKNIASKKILFGNSAKNIKDIS